MRQNDTPMIVRHLAVCGLASLIAIFVSLLGMTIAYTVKYGDYGFLPWRLLFVFSAGLAYALVLGFVGAFIFLTTGLTIARWTKASPFGYVFWGAAAGVAHEGAGLALQRFLSSLPNETANRLSHAADAVIWLGGFAVTFAGYGFDPQWMFVIAPIAGACAGLFAGWQARNR